MASQAKRTRKEPVESRRREASRASPKGIAMPIGGADVDDKRPEIIAALTAAEIVRATAHRANFEA